MLLWCKTDAPKHIFIWGGRLASLRRFVSNVCQQAPVKMVCVQFVSSVEQANPTHQNQNNIFTLSYFTRRFERGLADRGKRPQALAAHLPLSFHKTDAICISVGCDTPVATRSVLTMMTLLDIRGPSWDIRGPS